MFAKCYSHIFVETAFKSFHLCKQLQYLNGFIIIADQIFGFDSIKTILKFWKKVIEALVTLLGPNFSDDPTTEQTNLMN